MRLESVMFPYVRVRSAFFCYDWRTFRYMVSGTYSPSLHAHLHWYRRMWIISLHYNVIVLKLVNIFDFSRKTNRGERFWFSLELCLECSDVVLVDVGVSELDDELARLGVGDVCDHVCEEGVGGNVERDTETEVRGALVHETREPVLATRGRRHMHIKLAHHMTRRKRHLWDRCSARQSPRTVHSDATLTHPLDSKRSK
jgi:hypothetical protein